MTHKVHWDFDTQTDHLISARRPDLIMIKKKKKENRTCNIVDFAVPADHRVKLKESEKKDKFLDLAVEYEKCDVYRNFKWYPRFSQQRINKGIGGFWNKRTSGDHPQRLHYWDQPEYRVESWRLEETCFHSNSSERPPALADVKNSQRVIIVIIII